MDTGAAANMSVGGSLIDDSAPLAQIESTEEINWKDGLADTRILVSVQKCPNKFRSRLGYHANLYITLPDGVERDIGYIKAWRISRPSGVNPTIDPQWCLGDWYFKPLETYDEGARQMAYCVRALYGKGELPARRLSDRFVNEKKKDEIRDGGNELVFIETIYIKWREDPGDPQTEYTGYNLAPIYLEMYYRLLGGKVLPAWFSLTGPVTYLLLPRLHREYPVFEYSRAYQERTGCTDQQLERDTARALKTLFQGDMYTYESYVTNAEVAGTDITVLGVALQPDETISEEVDRLILPTNV